VSDLITRLNAALEGRYRIERELGAGGMATVYLAQDLKHDRHVAVKAFRPEVASHLGGGRFLQEIEIVARIEHPHILTLIDSGDADGLLYFVMPYVSGESLRTRLAKEETLPIADVIRLMRDVADGLAEAHRHGLVHRDIKPDNIMMSGNHAVVMDFGVAKAASTATGEHHVTTVGMTLGTPTYMSPEQAAAEPDIDHRTDIYALGVLAYELLTGRPPLTGSSAAQILAAHVTTVPDAISEHRVETPPALEAVVMKCLEKKPEDRWQRTDEILQQLESIATPSGGVPSTQVPGTAKRERGSPARVRWLALAVTVVTVVGLAVAQQRRAAATSALLSELQSAAEAGDPDRVYSVLLESGRDLGESAFDSIAASVGGSASFTADPAGSSVQLERVPAALDTFLAPMDMGSSPVSDVLLVAGEYRATISRPDHQTAQFPIVVQVGGSLTIHRTLVPEGWQAADMVYVDAGSVPGPLAQDFDGVEVPAFLIDQFEVSNQRFMRFVVEGGYRDSSLWSDSMQVGGAWVGREQAIASFVDRTGLPGPRGWSGGTFPDGRADHPVEGVNWYEAEAFAAWSGKQLPSIEQWWRAALGEGGRRFPWGDDLISIDVRSNFGGTGTTPVEGFSFGTSPYGAFNMAGNVREWIAGAAPDGLFTALGGSWLSPTYMFDWPNLESLGPSFHSDEVGFRLVMPVPNR
jgi:eukaryotic-like serine/threonine-protein kinase